MTRLECSRGASFETDTDAIWKHPAVEAAVAEFQKIHGKCATMKRVQTFGTQTGQDGVQRSKTETSWAGGEWS